MRAATTCLSARLFKNVRTLVRASVEFSESRLRGLNFVVGMSSGEGTKSVRTRRGSKNRGRSAAKHEGSLGDTWFLVNLSAILEVLRDGSPTKSPSEKRPRRQNLVRVSGRSPANRPQLHAPKPKGNRDRDPKKEAGARQQKKVRCGSCMEGHNRKLARKPRYHRHQ